MVCCFSSYTNSQHIEEIFFNYAQERTWLTKVIRFFCSKQDDKKRLLLPCRLAVWKWVIISYTLLCCTSDQKLFLKENSHKTHSKWSITNYLRQGVVFLRGVSENYSKTGRLFALTERLGELNQNGKIPSSDGEILQVCKIVRCNVLSHSQKLYTAIKEECTIS